MNNDKEYDVVIIKDEHNSSQNYSNNNDKYRSLNEAINYDYDFSISDLISEAWEMVNGNKLPIFISIVLAGILGTIVSYIGQIISALVIAIPVLSFVVNIVFGAASSIFAIGVIIVVLKLANREKVDAASDFCQFTKYWVPILILSIVMSIIVAIGFALLIIPGIYLAVAYSLAYWILVIHPNASFWDILEASRKIVTRHWFKFFILSLVLGVILFISAIPLGIGLIWTLPLCNFAYALIFKKIFEK